MIYFFFFYTLATGILLLTWKRMRAFVPKPDQSPSIFLSVIIPVRNEAKHILLLLNDLQKQQYSHFEVIIVDDDSEDDTFYLASNFDSIFEKKVVKLYPENSQSPKKRAITQAMSQARGELIVCTDGDCRVPSTWLLTIAQLYQNTQAKLISGGVTFHSKFSFFSIFQTIEFASLIGSGACAIYWQKPNMCNGANIAYTREVFEEVHGFEGNEHIASGDDEFLMHKIAAKYPNDIHFLKSKFALVHTQAQESLGGFVQQRRRWASKWRHYQQFSTTLVAVYVFLVNFLFALSFLACLLGYVPFIEWLPVFVAKCGIESIFLASVLGFMGHFRLILWIPVVQIIYPFYVSFFGILAQFKHAYQWKGRQF